MFDGKLGHYKEQLIHLEIDPNFPPVHRKPYSVPRAQQDIFLKELQHLVEIGVLRPCGPTEWASPTFIIPKKIDSTGEQRLRWVSDLQELNKALKRRIYPLPLIQEVIKRRSGYE